MAFFDQGIPQKFFLFMIFFITVAAPLFCSKHFRYPYNLGEFSSGKTSTIEKLIFQNDLLNKEEKKIGEMSDGPEKNLRKQNLELIKAKFARMTSTDGSPMGTLIARGLVGEDLDVLEDMDIKSISDGVWAGVTTRTARACGDVISDKIKGTAQTVIGGAWDSVLDTMLGWWNGAITVLFNDSKKPFSPAEVTGWKALVKGTFEDIQKILKEGPKESLQGHGMVLRSFDDLTVVEDKNSVWEVFIKGYIDQFDYIIFIIEQRKQYYSSDDPAVHYATSVQETLATFKNLLQSTKTIKDLDDRFDSNKCIIPGWSRYLENLFDRLTKAVEPRSYSMAKSTSGANGANDRGQRRGDMQYEDIGRGFNNYLQ
jgi:hypothetical protein